MNIEELKAESLRRVLEAVKDELGGLESTLRSLVADKYNENETALDAVGNYISDLNHDLDSLRASIEAAEKQEPYGYDSCGDLIYRKEDGLKSPNPIALYALPPMPAQQQTYTVKVYNKGGSGEFKRLEGIEALEDGQKLIAIESGNGE